MWVRIVHVLCVFCEQRIWMLTQHTAHEHFLHLNFTQYIN